MNKYFLLILLSFMLFSCSEYQKAIKSEDVAKKFEVGTKMYDAGKYEKAIKLFEQIAPAYRGKPQAEKMFYMYAMSYYKTKQYYISSGRFESFVASYPKSEKKEEAAYLEGVSYANVSPSYSLDQTETNKALTKIQDFIDEFPNSEYLPKANEIAKSLREKLEKKAFEVAKQYNTVSEHKAAIVALDIFVNEFPGTKYKEEALFIKLDSAFFVAENSINTKMKERLLEAKLSYETLLKYFPNSSFKEKADVMMQKIETDLKQFSN